MPKRFEPTTSATARRSLASFHDDDLEDFFAVTDYLPQLAREEGREVAIGFAQTELRALVAMLALARPADEMAQLARRAIGGFFSRGSARLLCDDDVSGWRYRQRFKAVIVEEIFAPSVVSVFERSTADERRPYVPEVGGRDTQA